MIRDRGLGFRIGHSARHSKELGVGGYGKVNVNYGTA